MKKITFSTDQITLKWNKKSTIPSLQIANNETIDHKQCSSMDSEDYFSEIKTSELTTNLGMTETFLETVLECPLCFRLLYRPVTTTCGMFRKKNHKFTKK